MASLTFREKTILEDLFDMTSGYVLDFSNWTFAQFIGEVINVDIYGGIGYEDYSSKANKLRQIWKNEPDNMVGTLTEELLNYCEDHYLRKNELTDLLKKKIDEMRIVTSRLIGAGTQVSLPIKQEETLQTLIEDINSALARNKPELVLDRLHTFSTKLLRQICTDNDIDVTDNKGNNLPLHSLAGMLKKKYEQNSLFNSSFTVSAIQNSISLFDQFNGIRNNQSYAHDNEVLGKLEAEFSVKIMADLITFIDKAEAYRKKMEKRGSNEIFGFDMPF